MVEIYEDYLDTLLKKKTFNEVMKSYKEKINIGFNFRGY
ncbi:hypothetical protein B0H99_10758 [Planomicrobium soli]|uniref:Uncharacterized protein n=1 Tax=Planomicrobium soli TaxID=1176648 RepID=A0A2P8GQK5_9BACL|nr:hypothetical protein B0H99_10758 [Planomicrobium soli]